MKAGVIGVPSHDFDPIESFQESFDSNSELMTCVEVRQSQQTDSGLLVQSGRAAAQRHEDREHVDIQNGTISVYERSEPKTYYTEFVTVPGEFIAVASGRGVFAFDLIGGKVGVDVEQVELDLDQFQEAHPEASPWKVGFYGHLGNAENGVIHGDSVLEDSDFGGPLNTSKKNQLGLEYTWEDEMVKTNMTESGYIEVYQPSSYDSAEFAEYLVQEVLEYTK